MKLIQKIRKMIEVHERSIYINRMEDVASCIESHWRNNTMELVHSDTVDEGERWTIKEISVYKIEENGEVAYFQVGKSVGRTECQSSGGVAVEEVVPKVEIVYVPKK